MADVIFGVFLLGLCFYVWKAWVRWFRSETRLAPPKWRSAVTLCGFCACSLALGTILLLIVYATVSSSLTPYHPVSLLAYRTIFAASVFAIVAGIIGKGPLETPTFVCSLLCLFIVAIAGFAS